MAEATDSTPATIAVVAGGLILPTEGLTKTGRVWYNTIMTNNDNTTDKGNTMTNDFEHGLTEHADNEDQHNTNWQDECQCEVCVEFNEAEAEYIRNSRHIRLA